ncbi:MAG: AAA family ATPase [Deltaproteobacteria bacterium]|nr:AAA family ATPase [Deltaproteobacteria bacterium]
MYVGRFGSIEDRRVGPFGYGLTLVRGNNEEGKTTLLELVRAVLFGFRERSAPNPYIPAHGGGRMGALEVVGVDGACWRIERSEGPRGGRVRILSAQGSESPPEALPNLLHRTDRHLFESVFAFGLKELQEVESLHSKEVQGRIMGAAAGTGAVSPVDVWRKLTEQSRALYRPAGRTQPVGRANRALDEAEAEIQQIRTVPARYAESSRQRQEAWMEREQVRHQLAKAQEDFARCQKLADLQASWEEFQKAGAHIKELEPAANFPPDGLRRLEEIIRRIRSSRELTEELESRLRTIQEERNRLIPNQEITRFRSDIDELADRAVALSGLPDELTKARGNDAAEHRNMIAALNAIGNGWDQEQALNFDASSSVEQVVIEWESRLREAEENLRRCRERFESAETTVLQKKRTLEDTEKALAQESISRDSMEQPAARDRLEEWLRFHERAQAARERVRAFEAALEETVQDKDDLARQSARLAQDSGPLIPGWLPLAAAMFFMTAALLAAWAGSAAAALITASGLAGSLLLNRFRRRLLENSKARLKELSEQQERHQQRLERRMRTLREELANAKERQAAALVHMSSISRELLGRDEISEEEARLALARARAAGERVGKRQALQLQAQQIRKELGRAREDRDRCNCELERAKKLLQQIRAEWDSWQRERSLDKVESPGALRIFLRSIREFQQAHRRWDESQKMVARQQAIWDDFSEKAAEVLEACGREAPDGFELLGAMRDLREECRAAQEAFQRKHELDERIREVALQLESAGKRLSEEETEREMLLTRAGAKDEESYRALAPMASRREELIAGRRELLASLRVGADLPDEESVSNTLQAVNWETIRSNKEAQASEVARLRDMLDSLGETIGHLDHEIRSMEQSDRLSFLLQQREQARAQLHESTWAWATAKAAATLLDLARQKYETQRQPMVIRWASDIFQKMTGGAFENLRMPLDNAHPMAMRSSGELVPTEHLSRGTMEQLYLSIRLALIREYVRQAGPLPVLMDDILVNFDPERGRAAALAINEFSRCTPVQVIFFTCHPHVIRHFKDAQDPPPDILDMGNLL